MRVWLLTVLTVISLQAGVITDAVQSKFSALNIDLSLIFLSLIGLILVHFIFKKIMFLFDISDFSIKQQIKVDEKRTRKSRQKNKISNNLFKTSQTKTEKKRRVENGRVISFQKKSDKQKKSLSQRIPKSVNSKSSKGSKRTNRNEFMTKKYKNAMNSNLFAKQRYLDS